MNPITTAPQEVKDRIIEMRRSNMSYDEISIIVDRSPGYVSAIWRMWMRELLGTHSSTDAMILEQAAEGKGATTIAAELNLSVSKVRSTIYAARAYGEISAQVSVHKARDPRRRRGEISWRDYELWRRSKLGAARSVLAKQFRMTRARVYQILADVSARIAYLETLAPDAVTETARHILLHAATLAQLPEYVGPSEE